MNGRRILVVDDEESLLKVITYSLQEAGYKVSTATDAKHARNLLKELEPDLLVLDIMLPDESGFELCRSIRAESNIPILILSAKTEEVDRILGLELGADDYVTKPFSPRELVSRIKALLRRTNGEDQRESNTIKIRDLKIDLESHQVFLKGKLLYLTNLEFQILVLLARNPGKVLSRITILNYLWDGRFVGDERTIDVHIHNLREKLETNPQKPAYLLTVRGLGYRLSDS